MKKLLIGVAATLLVIFIILGVHEMRPRHIASHAFNIPREYQRDEGVFWIPESQDVLKFVLNPQSSPEDQILVSVESYIGRCPTHDESASAICDALDVESYKILIRSKDRLVKLTHPDGEAIWTYQSTHDGEDRSVASCFSSMTEDLRGGFCSSRVRYDDLLISIRYREDNITNLSTIIDEVGRKLSEWDQ